MRPPFAYYGGKTLLAEWIVSQMPDHDAYVEPFAGSLAVLLAKPRVRWEAINDLDGDVVAFWRALRDMPEELERVCTLTPYARSELKAAYEPTEDPLEQARRLWVRTEQGIGRKARSKTGWQVSTKDGRGAASQAMSTFNKLGRFGAIAERLAGVHVECRPAVDVIRRFDHQDALVYCDPPYLPSSRRSNHSYTHEMGEDDHRELSEVLHGCKSTVLLSGYHSEMYDELYGDWPTQAETAGYANTSNRGRAVDTARTEVLWSNRLLKGQTTLLPSIASEAREGETYDSRL